MSGRLGARRRARVIAVGVTVLIGAALFAALGPNAGATANSDCPGFTVEFKVDQDPIKDLAVGESRSFTVNGHVFTFTKVIGPAPFQDDSFDFVSADFSISAVYVKGGSTANVYTYDPAVFAGTGLHPNLNGGGQAPAVSHVSLCAPWYQPTTTTSTTAPTTTTSTTIAPTTTTTEAPTTTTTEAPTTTTTEAPTTTTTIEQQGSTTTTEAPTTTTTEAPTTTTTEAPTTTTTIEQQGSTTTTEAPTTTTTIAQQGTTTTSIDVSPTTLGTTTTSIGTEGSTIPSSTTSVDVTGSTVLPTDTGGGSTGGPSSLPFTGGAPSALALVGLGLVTAGLSLGRSSRLRNMR